LVSFKIQWPLQEARLEMSISLVGCAGSGSGSGSSTSNCSNHMKKHLR
jgi:hypothetical protein